MGERKVLSLSTLELLRHAGESFRSAQKAVARELQSQLDVSAQSLCHLDAHASDNNQSRQQVQEITQLARKLYAVNDHVWALFAEASILVDSDSAPPSAAMQPPAPPPRTAPLRAYTPALTAPIKPPEKSLRRGMSPNDQRVLDYLMGQLNEASWTRLTFVEISQGSGVPLGSIGIAMRRLLRASLVCESNRGNYRLSST